MKTSNHSKNDRSSGFAVNIRHGLRLFSLFILFQSQSALRNTFYIGAIGKTIPTIQLDNDLSATVLRYLRLQEQKQQVETRVKTLDAEMQRLKGRIVAKLNSSCMAMGEYVTMSESRRFSIKAKEADESPLTEKGAYLCMTVNRNTDRRFPHSKLAKLLRYNGSDLNSIGRRTGGMSV